MQSIMNHVASLNLNNLQLEAANNSLQEQNKLYESKLEQYRQDTEIAVNMIPLEIKNSLSTPFSLSDPFPKNSSIKNKNIDVTIRKK